MRNNWPFLVAASLFNSLLITGAFIEFKIRGDSVINLSYSGTSVQLYTIHNSIFAAGMFVLTFLVMLAIIGIVKLIAAIVTKLYGFNKGLTNSGPSALVP